MSLGAFYSRGTGVEKDYAKSFKCYKAAADQGIIQHLLLPMLSRTIRLLNINEILIIGRQVNLR